MQPVGIILLLSCVALSGLSDPLGAAVQDRSTGPAVLRATPESVSLSAIVGGADPAMQVQLTHPGSGEVIWTARADQDWIVLPAASGETPFPLQIGVTTQGLAPGNYSGIVTVTAAGASETIPVQVTVASDLSPLAGRVFLMKGNNPAFDRYTNNPPASLKQFLNDHMARMRVFSPYFDSRTSWYSGGLVYADAYAIYPGGNFGQDVPGQHPEWVLRDVYGNRLYIPWGCLGGTCPQYAADFSNPGFQQFWIDGVRAMLRAGNYKGIFIDDVNMDWRVGDGHGNFVTPWNANTNAPMTIDEWRKYMAGFLTNVRSQFSDVEICHNSIWFAGGAERDSNQYVQQQIAQADDIYIEFGVNDSGLNSTKGAWSTDSVLSFAERLNGAGKRAVMAGIGNGNSANTSGIEYGVAAYLLINNGKDYAGDTDMAADPSNWWTGFDVDLGAAEVSGDSPGGGRYWWNGLMRRDFAGGMVLLNGPGGPAVNVALPGTFRRVDGATVTSLTLPPSRAAILLK
jgi:hypothetical protein